VRLTTGFWLADTACTQALWLAVMGGENPSRFQEDARNPVENVSWDDSGASGFLQRVASLVPGVVAELPTEAEWEYACRAGSETPFNFGATIGPEQANYDGNHPYAGGRKGEYRQKTVPVKSFAPNDWGLHEMHGNVWEWCADGLREYADETVEDPRGPEGERAARVVRGGSWHLRGRVSFAPPPALRGAARRPLRDPRRPGVSLCPEVHQPGGGGRRGAPACGKRGHAGRVTPAATGVGCFRQC
jgi:formylglycine-generating enzyme required for sulfatase activity